MEAGSLMRGEGSGSGLVAQTGPSAARTPSLEGTSPAPPRPRPRSRPALPPKPSRPRRGGAWSRVRVPGAGCARLLLRNCARLGCPPPTPSPAPGAPDRLRPPGKCETPALRTRPGKPPSQRACSRLHGHGVRRVPRHSRCPPSPHPGRPPGLTARSCGPGRPWESPAPRGLGAQRAQEDAAAA